MTDQIISNKAAARAFVSLSLLCILLSPCAYAASDSDASLQCASKPDNIERLECYDALNVKHLQESPAALPVQKVEVTRSYFTRSWDLDNKDDELLGEHQSPLKPHRVSYLIVRKTSETNMLPYSPTHAPFMLLENIDLTELKFQYSQKAKVLNPVSLNFLGVSSFRLWGAYTQQSSWQAFNGGNSSPFRETIYEPELIGTFSTDSRYGLKLVNLGYVHQSNGRNGELSRSWNRLYLQGGWEVGKLSALVRGWWRIPETTAGDDNPDIEDYIGRAEINLHWAPPYGDQIVGLTLRNNLNLDQNRSFIQLDWATPVKLNQSGKLHIQFTSGYGETLIDYNFRQTTLGFGASFRDW